MLRCPWMTGALSRTKSMFSKSIASATVPEPGTGRLRTNARTASFIRLMVLRYAEVTDSSNGLPAFQFCQKKKVVGSGR